MKKKLVSLILLFVFVFIGCENDNLSSDAHLSETKKISLAKVWFNDYEGKGENIALMQNLDYKWNDAQITKSNDGTETIIVPINELKKDARDFWEQRLYIYKLDKESYKALVYEIYTNKNVPSRSQSIDGDDFTGFISVWDLKTGFVRAARFEDNQVVENGVVEVKFNDRGTTNKAPIEAPCIYADFGDGGCDKGSGGTAIPLREVIVYGPAKETPIVYMPRDPVIVSINTGSYTSSSGGGGVNTGGGGIKASTPEAIAAAIQKQIYADKLPPCLKKILDDLVKINAGPGNMINKFSGNDPSYNYNWTMETGRIAPDVVANTLTGTYNTATGIKTVFDIGQFPDATELSWARTMLHESIHAYLITYFNRNEPGFQAEYSVLYDKYGDIKLWNPTHHDEIARSLIQSFGGVLESYGISKGYKLDKQFYEDMAWGGLENTDAFKKLPLTDRRRISNVINIELRGMDDLGNKKLQKGKKIGC